MVQRKYFSKEKNLLEEKKRSQKYSHARRSFELGSCSINENRMSRQNGAQQIERLLDLKSCLETTKKKGIMETETHSWPNEHLCCTMKEKIFFDSHQTPILQVTVEPTLCIRTLKFETHLVPSCGIYDLVYNFVTHKVHLSEKQRGCLLHPLATNVRFCLTRLNDLEIAEPNHWVSVSSLRLIKKENDKQVRLTAFSTSVPVSRCGTYQFCILSGWTSWSLTLKNQECKWCKKSCHEKEIKELSVKKEESILQLKPQQQTKLNQKTKRIKKKKTKIIKK